MTEDKTFDLDALEAEASDEPFPFRVGGQTFTLPAASGMDWRAGAAIDSGQYERGLRLLLGEDYDAFCQLAVSTGQLSALINRYQQHLGLAPGEPQASSGTSKRTARRSRRTSNASTANA